MTDRYAVFGHPIAHSKSPLIHTSFAQQTGQNLIYEAILAPLDGFIDSIRQFQTDGGKGANITVPFKEQAFSLCNQRTLRAELAGAVNTLVFANNTITGDNTDGAGLIVDLTHNLGFALADKHVLLLGAGGAARGVTGPLLECSPARLVIANRTASRAQDLAAHFQHQGFRTVSACGMNEISTPFDLIINATAASLSGALPPISSQIFKPGALAYDMMYGKDVTPFMKLAQCHGAHVADGLGMLVEQAAEAFYLWRSVRPATAPVIAALRAA
ncbi:MAG: shikimate dehydrogenase [Thiobacillaceae bacterium]